MRPEMREFLEEEATGAARSKESKRERRKKGRERFRRHLVEKAERLEASGNPRAAKHFRDFWRKIMRNPTLFPEDTTDVAE